MSLLPQSQFRVRPRKGGIRKSATLYGLFDELEKISAQFIDPFSVLEPGKKMNQRELSRAVRQAMAAELEAVHLYEAFADATDNAPAKKLFQDIADEEKVHAGEFEALLRKVDTDQKRLHDEGLDEARPIIEVEHE